MNLKRRSDLIDYDYIDKLNEKEKAWLNKFTEEYVHDNLDRENLRKNLHRNKRLKKDCDDRNNARNRCVMTRDKAKNVLNYIEDLRESTVTPEEDLNNAIDIKILGLIDEFGNLKKIPK